MPNRIPGPQPLMGALINSAVCVLKLDRLAEGGGGTGEGLVRGVGAVVDQLNCTHITNNSTKSESFISRHKLRLTTTDQLR